MSKSVTPDDIFKVFREYEDRLTRLEKVMNAPVPHARMTWVGNSVMTTNTHYGFNSENGLTDLGAANFSTQFDSTGDPFTFPGDIADAANGRLNATEKGIYITNGYCQFAANTTLGQRFVAVRRNDGVLGGVAVATTPSAGASNGPAANATGIWPMEEGDYFEISFYHNIGSNLNLIAAAFMVVRLGPTPSGL
jgi:hypothetical protein